MRNFVVVVVVVFFIALASVAHAADVDSLVSPTVHQGQPPSVVLPAHAKRTGAVSVDLDALKSAKPDGVRGPKLVHELHFELFPGVAFDAVGTRLEQDAFGNTTWIGTIRGAKPGKVTLTFKGDTVLGRVDLGLSQFVVAGSAERGFWVSEIDSTSYRHADNRDTIKFLASLRFKESGGRADAPMLAPVSAGHTIDILILMTGQALGEIGLLDPTTFIAQLVADANQSFFNSGVDAAVRVVGYEPVAGYTEPIVSGWPAAYDEFARILAEMDGAPGPFSSVPNLRNQYAADIVVLLVDGTRIVGPCGVSWAMNDTTGADSEHANIVLSTACALGDRTMTHEVGHVLAGRHDIALGHYDPYNLNPFLDDFGFSSTSNSFRTIMGSMAVGGSAGSCSSPPLGCPRINRWSSLTQTWMGAPLGITKTIGGTTYATNMVRVLGITVPVVATYRSPAGLALPGAPGSPSSWYCNNSTHISWGAATGTVGWYEAELSSPFLPSGYRPIYRGPRSRVSLYLGSSHSVRVKACNANGCGPYTQGSVPATQPGCQML